ncbi:MULTISPECIES: TraV family lipoprotein [Sphingomonadales]|uniref:Conjugal transfer protein TraV n=3 Tax=Sphingomonadaceae TaxID=41297 RepID=A0A0S3F0Y6_9SPHN|nr:MULTISPECIES: TraV family lipoprotein [Sphingomonadaceae]ALR21342.1 conjugal transfer protein TraV [Sphingobium baderi]AMG73075.1 Conjugal transfer protein TraV [Sphingopyxis granuli]QUT05335.1 TraV family lipoprotein [Sphingobium phenoxybenzoativorans]
MRPLSPARRSRALSPLLPVCAAFMLSGCATLGSVMSPYSEKFSCKNNDHGQCIHPEKAYADAVAGVASKSDPAVTRDRKLIRDSKPARGSGGSGSGRAASGAFAGYRDSVYRELQGLIEQPVTPMLKPSRSVRTLILPYADRQRPDRLYMPRYVYSLVERPQWVVGDYLVAPVSPASRANVLEQVRDRPDDGPNDAGPRP